MEIYDSNGEFCSINMVYNASEHEWYCECDRTILRYKYVINDIIRLNDPLTNHYVMTKSGRFGLYQMSLELVRRIYRNIMCVTVW